jgi:hypothetical protein
MTASTPSLQALRDLWLLGRRFAAFSVGASSARFVPKMSALKSSAATLERLGVAIDAGALAGATPAKRKKLFEGLRRGIADAAARLHGPAARPVFALAAISVALDPFARAERQDLPHKLAAAQKPAAAFLAESEELEDPVFSELAELRGWCEAIENGFAQQCDNLELAQLLEEAFWDGSPEAPEAADEPNYNFRSAPIEHVITMVVMHHVICTMGAIRSGPGPTTFEGDIRSGEHTYDDQSESHFAVAWSEHGIVGLAFHKYAEGTDADRWLRDLPASLRPLLDRFPQGDPGWTSGFWITRDARHLDRAEGEDGSNYFEEFTCSPRVTLHERPNAWAERFGLDEARAELAVDLARRALSGGGAIEEDEIALMIEASAEMKKSSAYALSKAKLERARASFAKVGLTFTPPVATLEREQESVRERAEKTIAARMSPDERALLEAARANDAAAVRALVAKGVNPEVGTVADQFEGVPPGFPPLFVALRARATEAALALIEGGARLDRVEPAGGPLVWAVRLRNIAVTRLLLERGLRHKPSLRDPPLIAVALGRNDVEMARLLQDAGLELPAPPHAERFLKHLQEAGHKEAAAFLEAELAKKK